MRWLIAPVSLAGLILFAIIAAAAEPSSGDEQLQWGAVRNAQHLQEAWAIHACH